jgi:glutamate dehydrogenase
MSKMEQFEALTESRGLMPAGSRSFFDQFTAGADTGGLDPADIAFAAERAEAETLAQRGAVPRVVFTEGPRLSLLIAVNEDRPFLFDSALAAAMAGGAQIRNVFHPILTLEGRKLSVIVFVIEPVAEAQNRAAMVAKLEESFAAGAAAVRDWRAMLARLKSARADLAAQPPKSQDIEEDLAFLDWLADDHFTLLGAREYRLSADGEHGTLQPLEGSGLGILADPGARVLGTVSGNRRHPGLSADVRAYLESNGPLIVSKSSARSTVHRRVHMD